MEYLLQLKDGYLLDIESDEESYDGCPTCNYNSEYINTITLICSKYTHTISISQMYSFALSLGTVMKVFLSNLETLKACKDNYKCNCCNFVFINGHTYCQKYTKE